MASAAASAFLEAVMGKLFMVLEKQYSNYKALEREISSLQQEFRMVAAAMDDQVLSMGRRSKARTAVARLHAEEMLDLEHDVEDCIDRFMHLLTCKHNRGGVAHEVKKFMIRSSFANEIHEFKIRLGEVRQRVVNINDSHIACQSAGSSSSATAAVSTRSLVGIMKPMEELLSLLDEVEGEPNQMRVISIVGFGGLGKTTLAKAVYDSPQSKEKFRHRALVTAGGSPDQSSDWMRGILRDVLRQVRPGGDAMDVDGQHLESLLKEYLNDKRYLIVIDDIHVDQLRIIESTFPDSGTGSRIILTTDDQQVANTCSHGNGYVYQMKTLGKEDSKELAYSEFRSIEPEQQGPASLLAKCDGLPLALVSVSDYLKSFTDPTGELCAELCLNLGSDLKEDGHYSFSELRKVLLDNYDSFSGYTLSCLLYLGIFPNNRPIKKKVIIRRWLAEGYARSDNPYRSEEYTAEKNFRKLIDRNIIQPVDTRNNAEGKTYKTHGIMHEFLLNKSLAQRFIATSSHDHPRVGINTTNARHLSVDAGKQTECVASDEELSRVRSLTIFGNAGDAISYLRKCKLIRVLDLQECDDLNEDHLKRTCELWHLKYLSLGGNISELQRSIERLHCLETLDLRRTDIKFLPIEAIMLPHLTHLFGKFMLHKDDLNNVKKMSKLLKFFSSNKSNLQTLAGFITDEGKGFPQIVGHMKKLRKVKIWCKHVAGSSNYIADLSQAIQKFTRAPIDSDTDRSLSIDFEECSENFLGSLVLEACSEDYKYHLRSLKLHGKLLRLPPFVTMLSGLTELFISSSTLTQDHLSALISSKISK
uniref:NB-ARC domain-containing protein n=1 Tax=Oryza glumipatula TaxID=40148 RepID=A0A0E0BM89_9ORYZ